MSSVADRLRDVDGADARVIAQLGGAGFQVEYIREELKSQYFEKDLSEAHQLIMADQVSGDDFKDLIGRDFEA
jgi:ribosomal protein S18 acetylase RimI-like enzyme